MHVLEAFTTLGAPGGPESTEKIKGGNSVNDQKQILLLWQSKCRYYSVHVGSCTNFKDN